MKNWFLIIVLLFSHYAKIFSQDNTICCIPGIIKRNITDARMLADVSIRSDNGCFNSPGWELFRGDTVIIIDLVNCKDSLWNYVVRRKGENYLLDTSLVVTTLPKKDFFTSLTNDEFNEYLKSSIDLDRTLIRLDTLNAMVELQMKRKMGLVVIDDKVYDISEYTEGTGFKIKFLNSSNKVIKYITVNFVGYNSVDDPVVSFGKSTFTIKGIGPIYPGETASLDKEYAWFTDIVEYEKIKSIMVIYMDGSTKLFKNIAAITLNSKSKKLLEFE